MRVFVTTTLLVLLSGPTLSQQNPDVTSLATRGAILSEMQMEALTREQISRCVDVGNPFLFVSNKEMGTIQAQTAYVAQKNRLSGGWMMVKLGDKRNDPPKAIYYDDVKDLNLWGVAYTLTKPRGGEVHLAVDPPEVKAGYVYLSVDCK
jgi:hypothetical protein